MRKRHIFLIIGIWMALLPFLGFPYSWKDVLTTLSGLILIYLSYLLFKEDKKYDSSEKKTFDNFSENHDFDENQIKNKIKIQ